MILFYLYHTGGSQVNGTTLALDKDLKPKPSNTKLVRRASEDEIIANFFEQLKKVATTATNKSISSPRPLSMTSPRLPEPEDDTRPQQDQTTSMEVFRITKFIWNIFLSHFKYHNYQTLYEQLYLQL